MNNKPINLTLKQEQVTLLLEKTKGAAKEIKQTEEATIYGVSLCAIRIFESLLEDKETKIPVSKEMSNWLYKILNTEKIFLSLYAKINQDGVKVFEDYHPNNEELQLLRNSYNKLIPLIPKKYS